MSENILLSTRPQPLSLIGAEEDPEKTAEKTAEKEGKEEEKGKSV